MAYSYECCSCPICSRDIVLREIPLHRLQPGATGELRQATCLHCRASFSADELRDHRIQDSVRPLQTSGRYSDPRD